MHLDYFYNREDIVNIDAAVVGISKSNWKYLPIEKADKNTARHIMKKHRYDVLPIENEDGDVSRYFLTQSWNSFENIKCNKVEYRSVIPFNTPIRTVIKDLAEKDKLFFFLSNRNEINGLISYVNLNCRQVKIFLFSLISELEIKLGNVVRKHLNEEQIINSINKTKLIESYEEDKKAGSEPDIVEYLYLTDLTNLIRKKDLAYELDYSSKNKFDDDFGRINDLRHQVAHPTRSLITTSNSVSKLWDKIQIIEKALFNLRDF